MVQLLCVRRFIHRLSASILVHRARSRIVSRSFFDPIEMRCRETLRKRLIYDLLFAPEKSTQVRLRNIRLQIDSFPLGRMIGDLSQMRRNACV